MILFDDDKPVYSGYVFNKKRTSEEIEILCYNLVRHLFYNDYFKVNDGDKCTDVIKDLLNRHGVVTTNIPDHHSTIEKGFFRKETTYNLIKEMLNKMSIDDNTEYFMYEKNNSVYLVNAHDLVPVATFEGDTNISMYKCEETISDTATVVHVVRYNQTDLYKREMAERNTDLYGQLVKTVYVKTGESNEELKNIANEYLDKYSKKQDYLHITCINPPIITACQKVKVTIKREGISKVFVVVNAEHKMRDNCRIATFTLREMQ